MEGLRHQEDRTIIPRFTTQLHMLTLRKYHLTLQLSNNQLGTNNSICPPCHIRWSYRTSGQIHVRINIFLFYFQELLNDSWRGFFELTRRQGRIKSVDIVLPKSWNLEKCYTKREVDFKRIPTRDKIDIFIGMHEGQRKKEPRFEKKTHHFSK